MHIELVSYDNLSFDSIYQYSLEQDSTDQLCNILKYVVDTNYSASDFDTIYKIQPKMTTYFILDKRQ